MQNLCRPWPGTDCQMLYPAGYRTKIRSITTQGDIMKNAIFTIALMVATLTAVNSYAFVSFKPSQLDCISKKTKGVTDKKTIREIKNSCQRRSMGYLTDRAKPISAKVSGKASQNDDSFTEITYGKNSITFCIKNESDEHAITSLKFNANGRDFDLMLFSPIMPGESRCNTKKRADVGVQKVSGLNWHVTEIKGVDAKLARKVMN